MKYLAIAKCEMKFTRRKTNFTENIVLYNIFMLYY